MKLRVLSVRIDSTASRRYHLHMDSIAFLIAGFAFGAPPEFPPTPPEEEARRDALTRYGLGIQSAWNEKPASAVKQFQAAAERDPKAAAPHRELAKVYAELGRDSSAIREAKLALAIDPGDHFTALLLAKLLAAGHNETEAIAAYRMAVESEALAKAPLQLFAALNDLSRVAAKAKDSATAEAASMRALGLASKQRSELLKPGGYERRELDRKRVELYERLAESQLPRRKFDSAVAAYETARDLSLDPNGANLPSGVARIHWNLSAVLMEKGEPAPAMAELEKYFVFLPASVKPYERYVELMKRSGKKADILATLRKFVKANPKNTGLNWLIAAEQMRAGDALFGVLIVDPGDADAFRVLVKAYFDTEKYKSLMAYADDLAKAARGEGAEDSPPPKRNADVKAVEQVRLLHGAIKAERRHTAELVRQLVGDFNAGTVHAPETLELVNFLALRDGQQVEFAVALLTAVRAKKDSAELYTLLFEVMREQRKWRTLAEVAHEAKNTPAFKNKLSPYFSAALAYAEMGDERKCLAEIDYVVSNVVADGRLGALLEKARMLNLLAKHRESLKLCAEVRTEFPAASAQRRCAIIEADSYHRLKENLKAEGLLREILADDPDDVLVLNNLGYHLADQSRKLPEAETMIRRAIDLDREERLRVYGTPEVDRGTYLDSLGWVLFRKGELEPARELLSKASQLPDSAPDAVVWDHLGDVQYRLNRKDEAKKSWAKAEELYKGSHLGLEAGRLDEVSKKRKLP